MTAVAKRPLVILILNSNAPPPVRRSLLSIFISNLDTDDEPKEHHPTKAATLPESFVDFLQASSSQTGGENIDDPSDI